MAKKRPDAESEERPKCIKCGATDDLSFGPDPYDEEVNDDSTPVWECGNCRDERRDGI